MAGSDGAKLFHDNIAEAPGRSLLKTATAVGEARGPLSSAWHLRNVVDSRVGAERPNRGRRGHDAKWDVGRDKRAENVEGKGDGASVAIDIELCERGPASNKWKSSSGSRLAAHYDSEQQNTGDTFIDQKVLSHGRSAAFTTDANVGFRTRRFCKLLFVSLALLALVSATFAWAIIGLTRSNSHSSSFDKIHQQIDKNKIISYLFGGISVLGAVASCVFFRNRIPCMRSSGYSLLPVDNTGMPRRNSNACHIGSSMTEKVSLIMQFMEETLIGVWNPESANLVVQVLISPDTAKEMVAIKREADFALRASGSSLYELVYSMLGDEAREAVLTHVDNLEENALVNIGNGLEASDKSKLAFVVSDMDDTLVSTFKDQRFPFNTLYPGVRQFYHELILSCCDHDEDESYYKDWTNAKDQVTFVTARPSWLNIWTKHDLKRHGFETSVALTGSSVSFATPATMLARKVKQCREMRRLFPEGEFFLVGDNGQRDIDLGKELIRHGLVKAVFIHDIFAPISYGDPELVRLDEQRYRMLPNPSATTDSGLVAGAVASIQVRGLTLHDTIDERICHNSKRLHRWNSQDESGTIRTPTADKNTNGNSNNDDSNDIVHVRQSVPAGFRKDECAEHGIILFQSYSGAALAAVQRGLLSASALVNIAVASAEDLAGVTFSRASQRARQRDVFLRDIARISHHLGCQRREQGHVDAKLLFLQNVLSKMQDGM